MLSPSPVSAKSIVFLLGLLYLQAYTADAAISTSAGFPQDVFAKPAFEVKLGGTGQDASTLPIKYSDAIHLLGQQQESSSSSSPSTSSHAVPPRSSHVSSLAVAGLPEPQSSTQQGDAPQALLWTLQRTSPDEFQLCSIPDFSYSSAGAPTTSRHASSFAASSRPRHDLIRSAQSLLDPLKKVCLYHTTDWFTYSFCHGREIRQFRQLGTVAAAQKAFKAAGGGEAGEKAAAEAAERVSKLQHPTADPEYPAFILGRWTRQNEDIVGDDQSHQRSQQQPLVTEPAAEESTGVTVASNRGLPSVINSAGLDLVEQVRFGDWDEEELFAAEANALAQFKESHSDKAVEATRDASSATGQESQRHRYLTQRWTNGTMCDMNHQPRTVEVQFHCSNRRPLEDRIVMFKETTICNYVLVIETPRLCADSAFGTEKEETPLPIQCHAVVADDFARPTLGDPQRIMHPPLSGIDDGTNGQPSRGESTKSAGDEASQQATLSSAEEAQEATMTSHTYGDPSRYGSVHDDYYDEALGGPGALYQLFHDGQDHHDHDHVHDHMHDREHDHVDDWEEEEIVVELSLDENGKLRVSKVTDETPSADTKETKRRDGGKKRNDDGSGNLELQLEIDDLMSVLRGEEDGKLQKKLADKIADLINKQMQHQLDTSTRTNKDDGGDSKKQPQQPALRMAKVGDSLSERVKRFYEAKQNKENKENKAAKIEQHLEL